jgi:hypothetical protein
VQQVFAEQVLLDPGLEVLVRGRDHSHVHLHRQLAANAIELAFGEHAQQARLQLWRHVADFVQEQRAAVGLLETAATQLVGAREGTLLVTEQFGLEQVGRKGGGVQRD